MGESGWESGGVDGNEWEHGLVQPLFNKVAGHNFIKKKLQPNFLAPTQVFTCEMCKIFKNTYFEEHLRTITPD